MRQGGPQQYVHSPARALGNSIKDQWTTSAPISRPGLRCRFIPYINSSVLYNWGVLPPKRNGTCIIPSELLLVGVTRLGGYLVKEGLRVLCILKVEAIS